MGWLKKIFKGSSHKVSRGRYGGRYEDGNTWNEAPEEDQLSDTEREDIEHAIALSLAEEELKKEKAKEKEKEQEKEESDEDDGGNHVETTQQDVRSYLEEDEQLAKALQESLNTESPPRYDEPLYQPLPFPFTMGLSLRICAGCNTDIGHGRYLSSMGSYWHPECFRCHGCNKPIIDHEFSMSGNKPYHKNCYKELFHPKCDVCKQFIPTNMAGLIEYRAHPFWSQKYCPGHELDGTPRCCSCERMMPPDTTFMSLGDSRKACLECLDSAIMDTHECQPLYIDIQEFYEGLNMKVDQKIPLLLVERQALNEAIEGEKSGHHHLPETRGLCLSEERVVSTIFRRPRFGANNTLLEMITEPYRLTRHCEVTAILVLYGLPRLLTGSILAHEMMHAWLRLKGYRNIPLEVEEGICQVLAHMWLESEIMAGSGSNSAASSSSSSSSSSQTSSATKKGQRSDFETQLGDFFRNQIEKDTSPEYGEGFRAGNKAVLKYGLRSTLEHIRLTKSFPE